MKIIKEIFKRKTIESEVLDIIQSKVNHKLIQDLEKQNTKKAQKQFEKVISSLKVSLKNYKHSNELGVYGTSRLLKTTQDTLLELGLEVELVKSVVRKIML